jgi:hypothetical protein
MIALPRVAPGGIFYGAAGQVWATLRAEIAMQWRRWGLWLSFAIASVLLLLLTLQGALYMLHLPPTSLYVRQHYTTEALDNLLVDTISTYCVLFFVLVGALLVVGRLGRDRQLGVAELQHASPQGSARYVLGKFLGNYLAVFVPAFLGYLLSVLATLIVGWPIVLLPKFLLAFLLVFVPSSLAAVSLTILLESFLPLRMVQVGFSLLWLYFNTGLGRFGFGVSIFNPSGLYIYPVFFPIPPSNYSIVKIEPTMQLALLNIAVLLLTALAALLLTYGNLVFQQMRKERV